MHVFFADDCEQRKPSRSGMDRLVSVGGYCIHADNLKPLEDALSAHCAAAGFPDNEEFKWSPPRSGWMFGNLVAAARETFFIGVVDILACHGANVMFVVEDTQYKTAERISASHEEDVVRLFVERADLRLADADDTGIIIADQPPGGPKDATRFLAAGLEVLQSGTKFVRPANIAVNILTTPSRFVRALQAADLVVGSCCSYVAGEVKYSPVIFAALKPIFFTSAGIIGGRGVKIHPDFKYVNLYHWLLGDPHHNADRGLGYLKLPTSDSDYSEDADTP